ncbi:MAG TPA: tetratricopeptide repeat protein, partial [Myxococcaceae bacterium]
MAVLMLACAACATVERAPAEPRLLEAQQAFDEGRRLKEAGHYAAAVPLIERALSLRETVLPKTHPKVADCLGILGRLHLTRVDPARAEPLLTRALEIRQAALGPNHPDVAESLNDLATLSMQQGLYARAELSYTRALEILEAAFGENHPEVAILLNNLASLYLRQRLYARAEPLLARALKIWEAVLSETSGAVLTETWPHFFATHNSAMNNNTLYSRAMSVRLADFRAYHPATATVLNNLASIYQHQGLYERAEPLYIRALKVSEATLGESHPEVAHSIHNLARLRLAQQNLGAALPLLERAFTASEHHLRQEVYGFSEKSLASFLDRLRTEEGSFYALARAHPRNARVLHLALSAALLRKGRSVQEVAHTYRLISRSLDSEGHQRLERLRALRTQLAALSFAGPGRHSAAEHQQRLQELALAADTLEAELARRSAPLRALTALPSAAEMVDRVAEALPRDGALVELITYEEDKPGVSRRGRPESSAPTELRYLALVLFPDSRIRAADLGPADLIDTAASNLRHALARRDSTFQGFAQAFYQLAFKPLLPLLGGTRRIILSPDGEVSLVPFAALHDGRQYLLDAFDFSYVTSGKDLLPGPEDLVPSSSLVVIADPDFGAVSPHPPVLLADAPGPPERSGPVGHFLSAPRAD